MICRAIRRLTAGEARSGNTSARSRGAGLRVPGSVHSRLRHRSAGRRGSGGRSRADMTGDDPRGRQRTTRRKRTAHSVVTRPNRVRRPAPASSSSSRLTRSNERKTARGRPSTGRPARSPLTGLAQVARGGRRSGTCSLPSARPSPLLAGRPAPNEDGPADGGSDHQHIVAFTRFRVAAPARSAGRDGPQAVTGRASGPGRAAAGHAGATVSQARSRIRGFHAHRRGVRCSEMSWSGVLASRPNQPRPAPTPSSTARPADRRLPRGPARLPSRTPDQVRSSEDSLTRASSRR